MVIHLSLKSLSDLIFLTTIFKYKYNSRNLIKITILNSPFHYKLVKTNLVNKYYFCKIEFLHPIKNTHILEFNSIKIEKKTIITKKKIQLLE